jgi:hypothetical protein
MILSQPQAWVLRLRLLTVCIFVSFEQRIFIAVDFCAKAQMCQKNSVSLEHMNDMDSRCNAIVVVRTARSIHIPSSASAPQPVFADEHLLLLVLPLTYKFGMRPSHLESPQPQLLTIAPMRKMISSSLK